MGKIVLKKVKVHNLKEVSLTLTHNQLIVFTGVSGSGKSSLAFDTIYVEGQRRYIESLSTYARRHIGDMPKPEAELIAGISPTIAIEQKTGGRNPRSTVGTLTGIYDYLRVLFARIGTPYCPVSGEMVSPQSIPQILHRIGKLGVGTKIILFAPYARGKKGEFKEDFAELLRKGFTRIRLDGKIVELTDTISVEEHLAHDIDLVIDRLSIEPVASSRLTEAITQALELGKGLLSVLNVETGEELLYSKFAHSVKSGISYGPLEPHDFSFNHPAGMCPTCQGLGTLQEFDLNLIMDPNLSIAEDCCSVASSYTTVRYGNIYDNLARIYKFSVQTPWKKLSEKAKKIFLYGTENKWTRMQFIHPEKNSRWVDYIEWKGVLHEARERYQKATSESYRAKMGALLQEIVCPSCKGERIKPYPAATQVGGRRIAEVTALSIRECSRFFESLELQEQELAIGGELVKEISQRLQFLIDVGLHYLTLDRTSPTLSGGEAQRLRLASQIGSGLVGATYVLDEPSIGLHPRDNLKLLQTLKNLTAKGNTLIVVEHDEETIREADYVVDIGPLAGENGGRIVVEGSLRDLLNCKDSLTGGYLSGRLSIAIPKKRRKAGKKFLTINQASHHNLKKISVKIPLGLFVAVTGVSGSGKSSLIADILYPALSNALQGSELPVGKHHSLKGGEELDKVICIDQSAIGRTPRSNPATYIKLFDDIRDLFSQLPESIAHGYKPGRFSFNIKEGSCPHCGGMGMIKIDMDFMEDEWVVCSHCKGKRFDEKTLGVLYRGKSIHDVLEMSVSEAAEFFSSLPKIKEKLDLLLRVGLDYLRIGQPSPTLSGGEAQRIKLAKELARPSTGSTLYILDEPTTGLHFHDIKKLVDILHALVEKGNTILVIEHNMDLVKTADWIIDLGPEGGEEGGEIIGEGTPEAIAKQKTPTGIALRPVLSPPAHLPEEKILSSSTQELSSISIKGASQNNLKGIDVEIPRGKITLCTGPSGSGKSSLAFETIYAEGQRRYIESLSAYARQFVKQMPKPKVEEIEGLSAAIAIEQKNHAGNPRSTIGTMTETYDYLRVLFAHLGTAYCPETGEKIQAISKEYVQQKLLELPANTRLQILSPLTMKKNETFEEVKERLLRQGFLRIRLNKEYFELDQEIPFDRQRKNTLFLVIDRLVIKEGMQKRLYDAIDQAANLSGGTLVAATEEKDLFFNLAFAVESTGKSYPPITPHTFSFNTEQGMCLDCLGLGLQYGADLTRRPEIMRLTPLGLAYLLWKRRATQGALSLFTQLMKALKIDPKQPLKDLPNEQLQILLNGTKQEVSIKGVKVLWKGVNQVFAQAARWAVSPIRQPLIPLLDQSICLSCEGTRLNPLARHVRIGSYTLPALCALSLEEASPFIDSLTLEKKEELFLEETLRQIKQRLHFLKAIGLHYLSLNRSAPTLSGGETQRIYLARQLGSGLTGCLYVLDEPTIGLHPHNNELLNKALRALSIMGNTLLLVEHDPMTISLADYILDFGPKAGKEGGEITARGTLPEILNNPASLTGAYLSGRKKIPLPKTRKKSSAHLKIKNASLHNLKNLNLSIPVGVFTCVSGVSGSGKSTLINDLLRPAVALGLQKRAKEVDYAGAHISGIENFDKLLVMDQSPIGHTIRADVSTYVDLLTPLRYFFASLPAAKAKGLQPKHFSFNHRKGMCTTCWGLGQRQISLQFLPPVKVTCEACQGFRLNPLSLEVTYKGKNLGQILRMTVSEVRDWLVPIPKAIRILDTLISVGLGYLQLGQEIASLSGGEAQRLRLSRELSKRSTGKTLYLFDEPTIGLHSEDILHLLVLFHALVDRGNTLIIIEHNLDVIAHADQLIDLGPDAGIKGGHIITSGTPEEVANHPTSHTAKYLKEHLRFLTR